MKTFNTLIRIVKDINFKWESGYGFDTENEGITENDDDNEITYDVDKFL